MSVLKLDEVTKKLLLELEKDSRQSCNKIGRKIGLKGETVDYRVNKLLREGLILRMFAEPNLPLIGLKTYRLYLKVLAEVSQKIRFFETNKSE